MNEYLQFLQKKHLQQINSIIKPTWQILDCVAKTKVIQHTISKVTLTPKGTTHKWVKKSSYKQESKNCKIFLVTAIALDI